MTEILVFPQEVDFLKKSFFYLDKQNTGVLSFEEFKHYFQEESQSKKQAALSDSEIREFMEAISLQEHGEDITFLEFIAGTVDKEYFYME